MRTVGEMGSFAIKSVSGGVELVLGPVCDDEGYYYTVQLISPVVSGRCDVYDHHSSKLAAYFGELAVLWWHGWEGEKAYESLEGQLRLSATRDSVGHVYLGVALRDGMGGAEYTAGAKLVIDAGQLDGIAEGVKEALGALGAA